jgi:hypothetical protein
MPNAERRRETGLNPRPGRRLSALAVVSLVLGVGSLGLVPTGSLWAGLLALCPIGAVVLGFIARRAVRASDGRLIGTPLAWVGIALGVVGLATTAIGISLAVRTYWEARPVVDRFFTLAGQEQWAETYDLFDSDYRTEISRALHAQRVTRAFHRGEEYQGFRWAWRLLPPPVNRSDGACSIAYNVRFSGVVRRYVFDLARSDTSDTPWCIRGFRTRMGP